MYMCHTIFVYTFFFCGLVYVLYIYSMSYIGKVYVYVYYITYNFVKQHPRFVVDVNTFPRKVINAVRNT